MIDHGHGCITPEPFDATLAAVAVAARPGRPGADRRRQGAARGLAEAAPATAPAGPLPQGLTSENGRLPAQPRRVINDTNDGRLGRARGIARIS